MISELCVGNNKFEDCPYHFPECKIRSLLPVPYSLSLSRLYYHEHFRIRVPTLEAESWEEICLYSETFPDAAST